MFERISDTRKSQAIVEQILEYIADARLRPGDRLPSESIMMEMLGVGRSSIREAKQILAAKHILEPIPGKGTFVREIGSEFLDSSVVRMLLATETLEEIYEVRRVLESHIAALAAKRATKDDLAKLESILALMESRVSRGAPVYDLGLDFHMALASATRNRVLQKLFHPLAELLHRHQEPVYIAKSNPVDEVNEHRELFTAIQAQDSERAEKRMLVHLTRVEEITQDQGRPESDSAVTGEKLLKTPLGDGSAK